MRAAPIVALLVAALSSCHRDRAPDSSAAAATPPQAGPTVTAAPTTAEPPTGDAGVAAPATADAGVADPDAPIDSSPRFIPRTQIEDTPDNRAVIALCERYRAAVEARDATTLLALASKDYLDDGGTADPGDDVDYNGLATSLPSSLQAVSDVRYVFKYQRVAWRGAIVVVDYQYLGSYRFKGIERRIAEANRLELARDGNTFKIVAGM